MSAKPEEESSFSRDAKGLKYDPNDKDTSARYGGDNGIQACDEWPWWLRFACGVALTINFLIFWVFAIGVQGLVWKGILCPILRPIYVWMDEFKPFRRFATQYIYTRERHADYFAQALLCIIGWSLPFAYMLHQQVTNGTLSWWQIYFYYFSWVGIRGGTLGGVYSIAHREGHNPSFYKPWIQKWVGNFFENILGPFYGSVPHNFTTTHIYLHHYLQAGSGDSFYQYDMDRTSWRDFMIFLHRIAMHSTGISALIILRSRNLTKQANQLFWGICQYFIVYPAVLLLITRSWSFLFYMYVQPFVGMTFFLSFMNFAFHAFVDYDEKGEPIDCVYATALTEGDDDYFGENDHMAHHYSTHVYWRDLDEHRPTHIEDFKKYHGAVFKDISIVECAAMLLFKDYKGLARQFVQYNTEPAPNKLPHEELMRRGREDLSNTTQSSVWIGQGRLTDEELACMIEARAKRREPKWLRV